MKSRDYQDSGLCRCTTEACFGRASAVGFSLLLCRLSISLRIASTCGTEQRSSGAPVGQRIDPGHLASRSHRIRRGHTGRRATPPSFSRSPRPPRASTTHCRQLSVTIRWYSHSAPSLLPAFHSSLLVRLSLAKLTLPYFAAHRITIDSLQQQFVLASLTSSTRHLLPPCPR
jgi:hypothetical protein